MRFVITSLCALFLSQSAVEQAVSLARQKRYAEARELWKNTPEPVPLSQRIAFHRLGAAIASGLGDAVTAATQMESALRLAPADPVLLLGTAMTELQAKHLDDASRHARAAGENATAKALVGDIEAQEGHFDQSVESYRQAIALAPGDETFRLKLAVELVRHQTFEPAIALMRQSASLFPNSARIRTLLGIALYAKGDPAAAIESLVDAIKKDASSDSAHACLAQIVLESSAAPAPEIINNLCKWNDTVCSALKLRVSRENGDVKVRDDAIAGLQQASQGNVMARCELARAYEWTNHLDDARREMEACLKADGSPQNHYRMGMIYQRLGLADLARREMQQRKLILQKMSEETAASLNSLKSFQ